MLDVDDHRLKGFRFGDADKATVNDSQCDGIEIGINAGFRVAGYWYGMFHHWSLSVAT